MSHSFATRYITDLESKISDAFARLRQEYESVEKNCSSCCLEESRTPERMESLQKSLDALCGVSYKLLGHVANLKNIEHVSDWALKIKGDHNAK